MKESSSKEPLLSAERQKTFISLGLCCAGSFQLHAEYQLLASGTILCSPCKNQTGYITEFFEVYLPCYMFSHSATMSGTRTKLLRPEWFICMLLTEGPSWHATGPQMGAFYGPKHNCVVFNSMYLKHCEDCCATC